MIYSRHFTPAEATKTLPLVRRIVEDILAVAREMRGLLKEPAEDAQATLDAQRARIQDFMQELADLGCEFKDWSFDVGLVDFPAIIDDEEVFLCWKSDEPALRYYHPINGGFQSRKPIPAHMFTEPS